MGTLTSAATQHCLLTPAEKCMCVLCVFREKSWARQMSVLVCWRRSSTARPKTQTSVLRRFRLDWTRLRLCWRRKRSKDDDLRYEVVLCNTHMQPRDVVLLSAGSSRRRWTLCRPTSTSWSQRSSSWSSESTVSQRWPLTGWEEPARQESLPSSQEWQEVSGGKNDMTVQSKAATISRSRKNIKHNGFSFSNSKILRLCKELHDHYWCHYFIDIT